MRTSVGAVRNAVGLLLGFGFGLILTSPTVSALSMVPGLSLLAPTDNSNVSGTITFAAAADSEGLVSLQFKVDGQDYGSLITGGSCRATFDSRSTNDGPHTITAVGQDEFGNSVVTSPATIFVNNVAPAISGVSVSNITSSSATVNWSTAALADGRVDYGITMGYGGSAYDSNMATSHSVNLTGLASGNTYHFTAMSFGQNGILSTSGDFVFTTTGPPVIPTPTPSPSPTPIVPNPTPTPSPTPVPTPTPIYPSPTPTPIAGPTPSPTPTNTTTPGTRGRTAPSDATYVGAAIPRTDDPTSSPTPTATGTAIVRGANSANTVQNSGAVSRASGQSVINLGGVNGTGGTGSTGSGQHLTVSMLMGAYSTTGSSFSSPSPTPTPTTNTKQRGSQSSDSKKTDYTPCAGPNPFLNEGGICVNGTWIKPDPQPQDSGSGSTTGSTSSSGATSGSTTGDPTTGATSGTSTTGTTSTDPTTSSATTSSAQSPAAPRTSSSSSAASAPATSGHSSVTFAKPKASSSCSTPDPYAAKGGVGMCVNGEWVLLFKAGKGK